MAAVYPQRGRDLVEQNLPRLAVGQLHTERSAIHPIKFVGTLRPWAGFNARVIAAFQAHNWNQNTAIIGHHPQNPDPNHISRELVICGDETGVQGRFEQNVGQAMSAIFASQGIDLVFGDFRATDSVYAKVPDVAVMDGIGELKFLGELKTPWVRAHNLVTSVSNLRKILGQLAQYLKDLSCRYGFISTYDKTIYVRQHLTAGETWELHYSPVVVRTSSTSVDGLPSLRQCMWYLGQEAHAGHRIINPLPANQWYVAT